MNKPIVPVSMAALMAALLLAIPTPASAGCYSPIVAEFWAYAENPRPVINVYVTTGGLRDVSNTGLTDVQMINAVQAAIQKWNEVSAASPRLRYAGELNLDTNIDANREPFSITVQSEQCATADAHSCADGVRGCHQLIWDEFDVDGPTPKSLITMRPAGCQGENFTWQITHSSAPMQPAVMHEFGHALGLSHSDESCDSPNKVHTTPGDSAGAMLTTINSNHEFWVPERDDILALRALYGYENNGGAASELSTNGGVGWSAQTFNCCDAVVPPSLGSSAHPTDSVRSAALVSDEDAVLLGIGNASGWNTFAKVDPGFGRTYHSAYVAQGRTAGGTMRFMVAWFANESLTSFNGTVRVGTRSYASATWTYNDVDAFSNGASRELALGFDDLNRRFVLAYVDSQGDIRVASLDPTTGAVVGSTEISLDVDAAAIGNPACYTANNQAWCAIPYAANTLTRVSALAALEGTIPANGVFAMTENIVYPPDVDGTHLMFHPDKRAPTVAGFLNFMGSYNDVTGTGTTKIYSIARGNALAGNPVLITSAAMDLWHPYGIGLMTQAAAPQAMLMRVWHDSFLQ